MQESHPVTVITGVPNFPHGRVFGGYRNQWFQREEIDGIEVKRVKTYIAPNEGFVRRIVDYVSFMITAFLAGIVGRRPDVVVATSPQFFSAICGWAVARIRRRPFVLEIRDMWPSSIVAVGAMRDSLFIRLMQRIEQFLYSSAEHIVVVTHSFKQEMIERGIDGTKITVVLNGVNTDSFFATNEQILRVREQYKLQGKLVVGYVGTHGLAHDLENVLRAVSLVSELKDVHFVFVGAGAQRSRVESIVAKQKMPNVTLIPQQPRQDIPAMLGACDLCLVPLRDSPVFSGVIPSKIFECMAMGVPMILSLPEGEATRLVRENQCGVTVAPERPDLLAKAISQLAADDKYRRELGESAKASSKVFSREKMAIRLLKALVETAQSK